MQTNIIYNVDILEGFKILPDNSIDLALFSPPYNVSIPYDTWKDNMSFDNYFKWCIKWLNEIKRVLKEDGRLAINIPNEITNTNDPNYERRVFIAAEYYSLIKQVGLHFNGYVRLSENSPNITNRCAWGSWQSASSPTIYNSEECVLLSYKTQWKKLNKGPSTIEKEDFMKQVSGIWNYKAETQGLTKANFSLDLPITAINLLSYQNDIVLDCFMGSGTTGLACVMTKRNYIGFEISKQYHKIAEVRIQNYLDRQNNTLKELF